MTVASRSPQGSPPRDMPGIEISWHTCCTDIDDAAWQRFFAPPRQGLFWFRALEAGAGSQFAYWYGLIRQGATIAGIVPAFLFDVPLELILPPRARTALDLLARGPLRRARRVRTFFIGNVAGEEGALGLGEGLGLGERFGVEEGLALTEVCTQVHDAARSKASALGASLLVWKDFPLGDREALDRLIHARGVFRIPSYPATTIPVVCGGYAAFLASQKASRRYKIKRKLSLGEATAPVDTRVVDCPDPGELGALFALFQHTYARGATQFETLAPEFFREIAAAKESRFIVLSDRATRRPVAFMLLLALGERVINQFVGIDYSLGPRAYLPFRLFARAYDWAAQQGAAVLCSGQTGYAAKLDLGHQLVPLWNYCHHANRLVNWTLARAASRIHWESLDDQLRVHHDAHRADYDTASDA